MTSDINADTVKLTVKKKTKRKLYIAYVNCKIAQWSKFPFKPLPQHPVVKMSSSLTSNMPGYTDAQTQMATFTLQFLFATYLVFK